MALKMAKSKSIIRSFKISASLRLIFLPVLQLPVFTFVSSEPFLSFSVLALLSFWARLILYCGDCPVDYRIISSIPGPYQLDASGTPVPVTTTKNISRHCQIVSNRGQRVEENCPLLRITDS